MFGDYDYCHPPVAYVSDADISDSILDILVVTVGPNSMVYMTVCGASAAIPVYRDLGGWI